MWSRIFSVNILKDSRALASSIQFRFAFSHLSGTQLCSVLQQCIDSPSPRSGQKWHAHILKIGLKPGVGISLKLLILHIRSGCLRYARQTFDQMNVPPLLAYNYLTLGYIKQDCTVEALYVMRLLACSSQSPDRFAFSMMLKLSVILNWLALAKEVHAQLIELICEWDDALFTGLLDSYSKNGRIDYARMIFERIPEKGMISSTAMISGYLKEGLLSKAEELFVNAVQKDVVFYNAMIEGYSKIPETAKRSLQIYIELKRTDCQPTVSTFISVLGSCSVISVVDVGQQIHGQLLKSYVMMDVRPGSALIDMYSKFGRIDCAKRVFDEMQIKNVVTWSAMIDGYGKNGDSMEALKLFRQMRQTANVKPNYVTFLSVLSSCSHAGLLKEGWDIFHSMERDYSLRPKMEHYACVVDLLGRLGHLEEAAEFIKHIPEEPSTDVWAALLGASTLHGDAKLSALAANEVFKLSGGERSGAYMALSNTFAASGNWSNVGNLRDLMKTKHVSKGVGSSWIGTEN